MSTPPPAREKRQRVPRACEECKRKKKQCSGTHPCMTCARKSLDCKFSGAAQPALLNHEIAADFAPRPPKRKIQDPQPVNTIQLGDYDSYPSTMNGVGETTLPVDETPIENQGRLLQDNGGRLLYIGDSATLSFLQCIRTLVERHLGPSPFTMDTSRHKILEAASNIPPSYRPNFALPDLDTALYLTQSFFANIAGLYEIFDKPSFVAHVIQTCKAPLNATSEWLCHLNLVFAIGLQMLNESSATEAELAILRKLESGSISRAEIFYTHAKLLRDPVDCMEETGISCVQTLLLKTIYLLASVKRDAAWFHHGMAVNRAYALGIHKEETSSIFCPSEQTLRRNLWQSLYIMDCLLSASLGRPNSISSVSAFDINPFPLTSRSGAPETNGIAYSVLASKIMGDILSKVYQKRVASRSIAYVLSLRLSEWLKELPEELHWRHLSSPKATQGQTTKRLHTNLLYFGSILSLTRPFLLHRINKQLAGAPELPPAAVNNARPEQMFCFHGASVRAALHSINGIFAVHKNSQLSHRDHFVMYWLFSSALILLANMFCPVHPEPEAEDAIRNALAVISYCGAKDPQARRYQTILESFFEVLTAEAKKRKDAELLGTGDESQMQSIFNVLFGDELTNEKSANADVQGDWVAMVQENMETGEMGPLDLDGAWPWLAEQEQFFSAGEEEILLYGLTPQAEVSMTG